MPTIPTIRCIFPISETIVVPSIVYSFIGGIRNDDTLVRISTCHISILHVCILYILAYLLYVGTAIVMYNRAAFIFVLSYFGMFRVGIIIVPILNCSAV